MLRRKMEAGIDFLGEGQVKINFNQQNVNFCSRILMSIGDFIDWM